MSSILERLPPSLLERIVEMATPLGETDQEFFLYRAGDKSTGERVVYIKTRDYEPSLTLTRTGFVLNVARTSKTMYDALYDLAFRLIVISGMEQAERFTAGLQAYQATAQAVRGLIVIRGWQWEDEVTDAARNMGWLNNVDGDGNSAANGAIRATAHEDLKQSYGKQIALLIAECPGLRHLHAEACDGLADHVRLPATCTTYGSFYGTHKACYEIVKGCRIRCLAIPVFQEATNAVQMPDAVARPLQWLYAVNVMPSAAASQLRVLSIRWDRSASELVGRLPADLPALEKLSLALTPYQSTPTAEGLRRLLQWLPSSLRSLRIQIRGADAATLAGNLASSIRDMARQETLKTFTLFFLSSEKLPVEVETALRAACTRHRIQLALVRLSAV